MFGVALSRWLAVLFGLAIPMLGVVRNRITSQTDPLSFFVDLVTGGFLLYGAWRVGQSERSGQRFLSAAWGLACGILYSSLVLQIEIIRKSEVSEAPLRPEWVAALTGLGLVAMLVGLITSLRSTKRH